MYMCTGASPKIYTYMYKYVCVYFSLGANSSARLLYMASFCAWQTTMVENFPHMISPLLYHGDAYDSIVLHRRLTTQRLRLQHVWPSSPTTAFDDYENLPELMPPRDVRTVLKYSPPMRTSSPNLFIVIPDGSHKQSDSTCLFNSSHADIVSDVRSGPAIG